MKGNYLALLIPSNNTNHQKIKGTMVPCLEYALKQQEAVFLFMSNRKERSQVVFHPNPTNSPSSFM